MADKIGWLETITEPACCGGMTVMSGVARSRAGAFPPCRQNPPGRASATPVMPVQAGIHDLLCCNECKSWIPACAGMTGGRRRWANLCGRWYWAPGIFRAGGAGCCDRRMIDGGWIAKQPTPGAAATG